MFKKIKNLKKNSYKTNKNKDYNEKYNNLKKQNLDINNVFSIEKEHRTGETSKFLNILVSKLKFNVKYKLINFLYISKILLKISKRQFQSKLNKDFFILLYAYYKKLFFNIKYFLYYKSYISKEIYNKFDSLKITELFTSFNKIVNKRTNINTELNRFLTSPTEYLSYDLNYYDFVSQTDINQNIKEQQFLIKKKKKLAKGTGFLFLPEKFLTKLSPKKKKLLTSYILQQQKRKKHEIYGYLNPLETKPLIVKGFIRPRKKMKKLGILYYRPTRRNLKMTFVDSSGQVLAYYSCGTNKKFKKARRRLKDVRERTLFKMTVQIDDLKYKRIIVAFKGPQFVKVFKVLKRRRLKIIGYSFDTLTPHNGCRKPKKKRK